MPLTSWRELLTEALTENGETWADVVGNTMTHEGCPFTAWTKVWVYFPVVYDGAEWVGWVRRNPGPIATPHQGGE